MNFADSQLGTIDASKNARALLAVRYFATTANYATGDYVVQSGQLYRAKASVTAGAFNASQWTLTGGSVLVSDTAPPSPTPGDMWFDSAGGQLYVYYNDGNTSQWVIAVNQNIASGIYLPLTGGAMTGPVSNLTLAADPSVVAGAATKRYVDAGDAALLASFPTIASDNRIVNGDMRIDQRNNGASGTAASYTVDRWVNSVTVGSKLTWQRNTSNLPGFGYCLKMTSSSAYTLLAADQFTIQQPIEADMITDFAFGTASAQPITLSFWVQSTLTGTFNGSLRNSGTTRMYAFTYSIPAANTWTRIVVNISGDTTGTWVLNGNGVGMYLDFNMGTGSSNSTATTNVWAAGGGTGATGAVSLVGTNGAILYLTGVKLEIGSVATPYNRQSLAKSQADCERYFRWVPFSITGYQNGAGQNVGAPVSWSAMRAAPTMGAVLADPNLGQSGGNNSTQGWNSVTSYGGMAYVTVIAAGPMFLQGYRSSATAEL